MSVALDKGGEGLEAAWEPCPGSGSAVLGCTGLGLGAVSPWGALLQPSASG